MVSGPKTAARAIEIQKSSELKTGIAQFDAEKLDQSKATLTRLAKEVDEDAMLYLGRIAIEQSDGDEAVDWLEQATLGVQEVSALARRQ